jgi:GTP-binding protein
LPRFPTRRGALSPDPAAAGGRPATGLLPMKIKTAAFETSAPDLRSCPKWVLPEFAFIGRSNVGKSSLINALAARRDLAKVSSTPGKTQLINFYVINEAWSIVDLPGYGYAEVGRQRRFEFNAAVAEFLSGRRNLRGVFVLIDSRLEPQAIDFEFLRWLDGCSAPYTLIFTKTDKQSPTRTRANIDAFLAALGTWRAALPAWFASSTKTGAGRSEVLGHIATVLAASHRTSG